MDWEPRVGMRVVCHNNVGAPMLSRGAVYTVSGIDESGGYSAVLGESDIGVLLHEVPVPSYWDAFHPGRFKPLDERGLDIFPSVLTKAPTPEKEPA
jgi:hypothetical protein